MRKLKLSLNVTVPKNAPVPRNLAIVTHLGSQFLVRAGIPTILNISDDEMSDMDIRDWYRKRYSSFGLGVAIENTDAVKLEASVQAVPEIKVDAEEVNLEPVETTDADVVEPVEAASVEKSEPVKVEVPKAFEEEVNKKARVKKKSPVDSMTYFEMVQFAKDHNIEVGGRGKDLYVKALKKWFKEHPVD